MKDRCEGCGAPSDCLHERCACCGKCRRCGFYMTMDLSLYLNPAAYIPYPTTIPMWNQPPYFTTCGNTLHDGHEVQVS